MRRSPVPPAVFHSLPAHLPNNLSLLSLSLPLRPLCFRYKFDSPFFPSRLDGSRSPLCLIICSFLAGCIGSCIYRFIFRFVSLPSNLVLTLTIYIKTIFLFFSQLFSLFYILIVVNTIRHLLLFSDIRYTVSCFINLFFPPATKPAPVRPLLKWNVVN